MIEIGPNLLAAILALVGLLTAVVAAYRAQQAHAAAGVANAKADRNAERISAVEINSNK